MKKETIITTLITISLNLLWSIVFDLLPNIVDFSIIREIQVSKYIIAIPSLVLINIVIILIFQNVLKRTWKREAFISQLNSAMNKLIEHETPIITKRPPITRPEPHQVLLKYYNDVIIQMTNSNGNIEFLLEDSPPSSFDLKSPVYLSNITPGMFKYFMVITQNRLKVSPDFVIISPMEGDSGPEFTCTWFDNIFPILGSMSNLISEKEEGLENLPESSGCYVISKYKFINRKGNHFIRISVV